MLSRLLRQAHGAGARGLGTEEVGEQRRHDFGRGLVALAGDSLAFGVGDERGEAVGLSGVAHAVVSASDTNKVLSMPALQQAMCHHESSRNADCAQFAWSDAAGCERSCHSEAQRSSANASPRPVEHVLIREVTGDDADLAGFFGRRHRPQF